MRIRRYGLGARWYRVLSFEALLYRRGRLAAVRLAHIRCGDRVLDIGCGTGLSFAPIMEAVGSSGRITGIDASSAMLRQAAELIERHRWPVELVQADARVLNTFADDSFDVAMFCYSLAIVSDWPKVWQQAGRLVRPGGRIAVVDTAYLGEWMRVLNPLVWVLLAVGGVRPGRRVWDAVGRDLDDVVECRLTGGHVRLAVGTVAATGESSR